MIQKLSVPDYTKTNLYLLYVLNLLIVFTCLLDEKITCIIFLTRFFRDYVKNEICNQHAMYETSLNIFTQFFFMLQFITKMVYDKTGVILILISLISVSVLVIHSHCLL